MHLGRKDRLQLAAQLLRADLSGVSSALLRSCASSSIFVSHSPRPNCAPLVALTVWMCALPLGRTRNVTPRRFSLRFAVLK